MATSATTRKTTKKSPRRDVAQDVTDMIIAQLEGGTVPWQNPWAMTGGQLPRSMATGKLYRGMNTILLGMYSAISGYTSPWWGTYKQIEAQGGQVRKGEKSSVVILYRSITVEDEVKGETVEKSIPLLRSFNVFNACQCDGLPTKYTEIPERLNDAHEAIAEIEEIVAAYLSTGPSLAFGGDEAHYIPTLDRVQMPDPQDFRSDDRYYSTLFHELTHSTGHKDRLNREGIIEGHRFGDELYAAEELIAEMGAAMLCAVTGIDQTATIPQSASYIENWLTALRSDKKLILGAAAKAQKAVDLIAPESTDETGEVAA
jgi:antirestriction protein ArdC